MTFGERLRKARLQNGLTQEQLAQQIGVAKSTLTGYEKGNREPDVFKIKRILEVLGLDSDYLLGVNRKTQEDDASAQTHEKYLQLNDESRKMVDSLIEHLFKMQTKGLR